MAQHAAEAADSSVMVQLHDAVFVWEETVGMAGHSSLELLDMATDGEARGVGEAGEGPKGAAGREQQQGVVARDSEGGEGEKQKENGSVEAEKSNSAFELRVDGLQIQQGALVVVCGVIGSGKTSLLEALLGEMVPVGGTCNVYATATYASQVPWIVNATLRENVLFGRPYDERRYQQVSEGSHTLYTRKTPTLPGPTPHSFVAVTRAPAVARPSRPPWGAPRTHISNRMPPMMCTLSWVVLRASSAPAPLRQRLEVPWLE